MRRARGRLAGIAATLVLAGGCADAPPERPSVLLIVVDSLRADHLGCYGHERDTSPHIDALAARGRRYARAYAQAPWTTPSVASLLTSRHPRMLGVGSEHMRVRDDELLLAEVLQDAGYATGAVVSHHLVSRLWGFAQGFDVFDQSQIRGHAGVSSPGVSDRGIAFLREHAREPFFLLLHYFDPHYAYLEHEGFSFADEKPPYAGPIHSGLPILWLRWNRHRLSESDLRELRRLYDSEIAFTDHHIGRVFAELRELGLEEHTVVVLTADHGEEFLEHGWIGHSRPVYESVVRVPLVVALPGEPPAVIEEPVALLDVFPTILDAVGLPRPSSLRGRSLLAPRSEARAIVTETFKNGHRRAVVQERYKHIKKSAAGELELYDVVADPAEKRDLLEEKPALAATLYETGETWAAGHPQPADASSVEIPEEMAEELRRLGYLE